MDAMEGFFFIVSAMCVVVIGYLAVYLAGERGRSNSQSAQIARLHRDKAELNDELHRWMLRCARAEDRLAELIKDTLRKGIRAAERPSRGTFTRDEIADLIKLCHPDRHAQDGQFDKANQLTRRLLELR